MYRNYSDRLFEFSITEDGSSGSFTYYDKEDLEKNVTFKITETKPKFAAWPINYLKLSKFERTFYLLPDGIIQQNWDFPASEEKYFLKGKFENGIPVGEHNLSDNSGSDFILNFHETPDPKSIIFKTNLKAADLNGTIDASNFSGQIIFNDQPKYSGYVSQIVDSNKSFLFKENQLVSVVFGDKDKPKKVISITSDPTKFSLIDYYDEGEIKAKINFLDGALHGRCELYDKNGTKLIETNFFNGLRNGLTRIFHSNGNVSCEVNYDKGKIESKISAFYENGESYNPKSGFLTTRYTLKYSKDLVWKTGTFSSGLPSGKQVEYNRAGNEVQSSEASSNQQSKEAYNGIFQIRLDEKDTNSPSFEDYNNLKRKNFYQVSDDPFFHFNKLNSLSKKWSFLSEVGPMLQSMDSSIEVIKGWPEEKFKCEEPATYYTRAIISYKIRPGDTLYTIAHKFDTTIKAIKTANHHTSLEGKLRVGQQIMIP